jgi:glycosyltransferase involved in cell wall biosynthesis
MFKKKIGIVTPWFGRFAGGAELLARGLARELNKRGVATTVFTTCSASPYDSWWSDHHEPGADEVDGIPTLRFRTGKIREPYDAVIRKISSGKDLSAGEEQDFFDYGINSADLVQALEQYVNDANYELIALPYFHGLTHSAINAYPGRISVIPCFHDEPQFYWSATERLLRNSKHIFFNSHEEKQLTIRRHGRTVGRRVVESVVTGVGVELPSTNGAIAQTAEGLPSSYFVYAGRKERGKNVHVLCEWFLKYARESGGNTKLVLMGGGDESLVPAHDCFVDVGFVPEARKFDIIRNSKGIINLSDNESFSIVVVEGWLCGVPTVVSARCAVTRGHVVRSNGGLFVSNTDEFSRALKYIEDNEPVRQLLAANGRQYSAREFSFDVVLARYLAELGRDTECVSR